MDPRSFLHPAAEYRPVPFWSWNDRLEPDRLEQQVAAFAAAGMGGFFMHARPGIRTAFLSEEWFAAVTASVEAAQRWGLQAWIYDESSYPSGFGGGFVPERRPDLAQKWLACRLVPTDAPPTSMGLAQFVISPSGYTRVDGSQALGGQVLSFTVETHKGTGWLNGHPYVDLLHPDSATTFLETVYEPYARRLAPLLGSVIPGVFTDEPNVRPSGSGACLPWTPDLPRLYHAKYGDDLTQRLPELFLDLGDYGATRYRYWRLVTERFIEAWVKPVYAWCEKRHLQFTGHFWEHVFTPLFTGSPMAPLEFMHVPGMDLLGRDVRNSRLPQDSSAPEQMGDVHMAKVVTSVAHQLGRSRVLSETYGGGGWDMTLETQKRYAEWEYTLGVNLLNQHLSHYSLRGFRKHDYPISFLDYQPWWPWYGVLADYFGRLSYALAQGEYQAELLVLHPMASVWAEWRHAQPASLPGGGDAPSQRQRLIELNMDTLLKTLSAANWGYDLGDDLIMEHHAKVAMAADGSACFQIGRMEYQAVIIPGCTNLAAHTAQLLADFVNAGGHVWCLPPWPQQVDGVSTDLSGLVAKWGTAQGPDALLQQLESAADDRLLQKTVRCTTSTPAAPLYHLVRKVGNGTIAFVANMGDVPHLQERVWLRGTGPVERWDLSEGTKETLPTTAIGDGVEVTLDFAETESHLLYLPNVTGEATQPAHAPVPLQPDSDVAAVVRASKGGLHLPRVIHRKHTLASSWRFQRLDPNVLVLDRCSYRVGEEPWSDTIFVQQVAQLLRQRYGVSANPIRDVQPWLKHPDGAPQFAEEVTIRYTVTAELSPPANLSLVVEDGQRVRVLVNGVRAESAEGHWLDPAFQRLPIGDLWQAGLNTIDLSLQFSEDLPVEPSFLLGEFAVRSDDGRCFRLQDEIGALRSGSWVDQGYPFFVGRAIYRQSISLSIEDLRSDIWLELSDLPNVVSIRCNGRTAGIVAWRPYRARLTGCLHAGENTIEIEVANSLHNALGPLHVSTLPVIIGPGSYMYSPSWMLDYRLAADGLANEVRLLLGSGTV